MRHTRNVIRRGLLVSAISAVLLAGVPWSHAGSLSADEQAFFDKNISAVVKIEPTKLDDPAVQKVFATPFYKVKVAIKQDDGESSSDLIVAKVGDKLVAYGRPSTDGDVPALPGMLNATFRLKADADAKALQDALDVTCPIIGDDDKKTEAFKHAGNEWTFIRGAFFDKKMGYVFTVDGDGKVTSVKYVMKLP